MYIINLLYPPLTFSKCKQILYKCKDDLLCHLLNPRDTSFILQCFMFQGMSAVLQWHYGELALGLQVQHILPNKPLV